MAETDQIRVNTFVETQLDRLAADLERRLDADVMAIVGPIYPGLDDGVRIAIETCKQNTPTANQRNNLAVVLETNGGIIEVVERMVSAIRHHYAGEVIMIVPNRAMSAGTVFAMSGDRIMMDYFSCLGPIDPQVQRNGKFVPALSYLVQYERLIEKSKDGNLTTAEMVMLQQLDLAELHSFEEARELSNTLLKEWLAKYKFKDWKETETHHKAVTEQMREDRALEVATKLMNHQQWHSHGRPISMDVLRRDIKLKIEDFGENAELSREIKDYQQFLADYMKQLGLLGVVHAHGVCLKWS
jgi:membrane-bound ClpP family serine protease